MRALRWIVGVIVVALALPPLLVIGFALWNGLDLGSFWRALRYERPTFTVPADSLERGPYADAVYLGRIERLDVKEASGLAASLRRDGLLWTLNDSGNPPELYAFDERGRDLGALAVEAPNVDWEALAAFEHGGTPYLVVADVGDNFGWRPSVRIHVVEEPEVPAEGLPEGAVARIAWSFRFRYEDGPRDCEAVAVDPATGQLLLLGKRQVPAGLYRVDLLDDGRGDEVVRVARRIADLGHIPQPSAWDLAEDPDYGEYRSMPTALDLDPAGRRAVVMTYDYAYEFVRGAEEGWPRAFARAPTRIPVPTMRTSEAVAFARDGRSFYATSEYRSTPIYRFDRLPAAPR